MPTNAFWSTDNIVSIESQREQAGFNRPMRPNEIAAAQIPVDGLRLEIQFVTGLIKSRSCRSSFLDESFFGEPGWDILLDLYLAHLNQTKLTIGSIGIDAKTPQTTVLRWLDRLEKNNQIERMSDPYDKRRTYIVLKEDLADQMHAWCAQEMMKALR